MPEWWAIREVATGLYMPNIFAEKSRPAHTIRPTDKRPPRLFAKPRDARSSLRYWLTQNRRKSCDFEIIPIRLEIVPCVVIP